MLHITLPTAPMVLRCACCQAVSAFITQTSHPLKAICITQGTAWQDQAATVAQARLRRAAIPKQKRQLHQVSTLLFLSAASLTSAVTFAQQVYVAAGWSSTNSQLTCSTSLQHIVVAGSGLTCCSVMQCHDHHNVVCCIC